MQRHDARGDKSHRIDDRIGDLSEHPPDDLVAIRFENQRQKKTPEKRVHQRRKEEVGNEEVPKVHRISSLAGAERIIGDDKRYLSTKQAGPTPRLSFYGNTRSGSLF